MSTSSLHIVGSRSLGGAEKFYVRLVTALHEAGQSVTAVNPPHSAVGAAFYPAVPQQHVAMRNVFDPVARWRLGRLAARSGAGIVQTYMGRATRLTHLKPGSGVVHVARLGGYYDTHGYRHAHAWIGNTRGICDYLIDEGFPADRVFHIGNFVDPVPAPGPERLRTLRRQLGLDADDRVVLGVGRLHANKDFTTLLEAFALLRAAVASPPLHLVIVGDGPLRQWLERRAERLELGQQLHWVGWQDDPHDYFHLAEVFVCPSRHEPLGNVILEAWANETPVIATRTRGAEELMADGRNGLLVGREDPEALAEALRNFLALSDADRAALVAAGKQTLETGHSKAAVVKRYIELYEALTAG